MFESLVGHTGPKEQLAKAVREQRLAHTLLFAGPNGVGKKRLSMALAAELLGTTEARLASGNHPDFHLIQPESKSGLHVIESLKIACQEAYETPFEAACKVFVIDAAERMQPAAANALLKTLEEPTPGSYWILVSANIAEMLPTILSRCALVRFQPLQQSEIAELLHRAGKPEALAALSGGSIGKALELAAHPEGERARELLMRLFAERPSYPKLLQSLEEIEKLVEDEDPVVAHVREEQLFECVALYLRDQEARLAGGERFFFPKAPPCLVPSGWEEALERAREGRARNLKLSACLESLILSDVRPI